MSTRAIFSQKLTYFGSNFNPSVALYISFYILYMACWCNTVLADDKQLGVEIGSEPATASCLLPEAGAPSCAIETAPGSSPYAADVERHVGNPIDVVSGNKYQYELDYQSPTSGLALARHYNSALSAYNTGFGPGWRHTFQVMLTRVNESQLRIVQSDGRLIKFYKSSDSASSNQYLSESGNDSYLEFGARSVWFLQDGRQLIFQGSALVVIKFPDHRGILSLQYRRGKLHRVTDSRGDALTFSYVPADAPLPSYDSQRLTQPEGVIASVALPGGEVIDYQYSRGENLMRVQYPGINDVIDYGYANENWPSHLTSRYFSMDKRFSQWRYDDGGLGIVWREGFDGEHGLDIVRSGGQLGADLDSERTGDSSATVTYLDGRTLDFDWRLNTEGAHTINCDHCPVGVLAPTGSDGLRRDQTDGLGESEEPDNIELEGAGHSTSAASLQGLDNGSRDKRQAGAITADGVDTGPEEEFTQNALARRIPQIWRSFLRTPAEPQDLGGVSHFDGVYTYEGGDIALSIETDRSGRVFNISIAGVSFRELSRRALTESMGPCFGGSQPEDLDSFTHERIVAIGTGADPCAQDWLVMVELMERLNSYAQPEDSLFFDQGIDAPKGVDPSQKGFWYWISGGGGKYCPLPSGTSCTDVKDALEYARLSQCAYKDSGGSGSPPVKNVPCNTSLTRVDMLSIPNLPPAPVGDKGFFAELYMEPSTGRYVLAFRGSDGGDDWDDNVGQSMGIRTKQYRYAVQLAKDLVSALPTATIEFTGHSLGGGLATAAALATERQATVFNAASFQPRTASAMGLTTAYENANAYVHHYHTRSDPVTWAQSVPIGASGQHGVVRAPGTTTELTNPDKQWLEGPDRGFPPTAWHSIDAVIHVLEQLLDRNCKGIV